MLVSEEDTLHHMEANHRPSYIVSPETEERRHLNNDQYTDIAASRLLHAPNLDIMGDAIINNSNKSNNNNNSNNKGGGDIKKQSPPRLIHPLLLKVPMHFRFGINGFICNVGFMVAYNMAVERFQEQAAASTIYSIVYLIFIPVGHALISLIVFGWPERYLPSLMSNAPIGVTAIALGAALTAYLDQISFNKLAVDMVAKGFSLLGYETEPSPQEEKGEFYSSLLVLLITGVWTFVLSVFINAPSEKPKSKEN